MSILTLLAIAFQPATLCLTGNDPVELVAGKEVPGKPAISTDFEGYRYQFATEENRMRFVGDPERYGVQIGGACGNMGPLSGRGSPTRWAVFEGRIWLFASEPCRRAFLAQPDAFVDKPDASLSATAAERAAGKVQMDRLVTSLGGAQAVDAVKWIVWAERTTYTDGAGAVQTYVTEHGFAFPNAYMKRETWAGGGVRMLVKSESGWLDAAKGEPMGRAERDYLRWQIVRHPVVAARLRDSKGFQVRRAAPDRMQIHVQGSTVEFAIGSTGQPKEARFRARAGGPNKPLLREYREWKRIEGLQVPTRWRTAVDGAPGSEKSLDVRINGPSDAALFEPPAG